MNNMKLEIVIAIIFQLQVNEKFELTIQMVRSNIKHCYNTEKY